MDAKENQQPQNEPVFNPIKSYVKEVTFDFPSAPKIFFGYNDGSHLETSLNVNCMKSGDNLFFVDLLVTTSAKNDKSALFNLKIVYETILTINPSIGEAEANIILNTIIPQMMYNPLRSLIWNITNESGCPPIMLKDMIFSKTGITESIANESITADNNKFSVNNVTDDINQYFNDDIDNDVDDDNDDDDDVDDDIDDDVDIDNDVDNDDDVDDDNDNDNDIDDDDDVDVDVDIDDDNDIDDDVDDDVDVEFSDDMVSYDTLDYECFVSRAKSLIPNVAHIIDTYSSKKLFNPFNYCEMPLMKIFYRFFDPVFYDFPTYDYTYEQRPIDIAMWPIVFQLLWGDESAKVNMECNEAGVPEIRFTFVKKHIACPCNFKNRLISSLTYDETLNLMTALVAGALSNSANLFLSENSEENFYEQRLITFDEYKKLFLHPDDPDVIKKIKKLYERIKECNLQTFMYKMEQ